MKVHQICDEANPNTDLAVELITFDANRAGHSTLNNICTGKE